MFLKYIRKPFVKTFSLIILLSLSACVTPDPYYNDADAAYQTIKCHRDPFKKETECSSAEIYSSVYEISSNGSKKLRTEPPRVYKMLHGDISFEYSPKMFFRTIKGDNSKNFDVIQLYFSSKRFNCSFYNKAYDINGNQLSFTEIDTNSVIEGPQRVYCTEDFALNIDKAYLEKNKDTGLLLKIEGKRGRFIFEIQPEFVRGMLKHLNYQ